LVQEVVGLLTAKDDEQDEDGECLEKQMYEEQSVFKGQRIAWKSSYKYDSLTTI
jgi:hypothetical protein